MADELIRSALPTRSGDRFWSELYEVLRQLARRELNTACRHRETLRPTALVHEAFVRLAHWDGEQDYRDRRHFLALAARAIRQALVDTLRREASARRGKQWSRITLSGSWCAVSAASIDALDLDLALTELAGDHPRAAQVMELRFFGGMTIDEIAAELELAPRTIDSDLRFARAWLLRRLATERPT